MKRINVYLGDDEFTALAAKAKEEERSMSDIIREALRGPQVVIRFDQHFTRSQVDRIRQIIKEG